MEKPTAKSPRDSSFLRTPSIHTFVTCSISSTSNLEWTYRELPRAASDNSPKPPRCEIGRYLERLVQYVSISGAFFQRARLKLPYGQRTEASARPRWRTPF